MADHPRTCVAGNEYFTIRCGASAVATVSLAGYNQPVPWPADAVVRADGGEVR